MPSTEKQRAHAKVHTAISSGVLVRQPCESCGATPADGHHEHYDRPLEVRWLCRSCHRTLHGERRFPEKLMTIRELDPADYAATPSALVPIEEIAERFGLSRSRVYAWIRAGKVPGAETNGRKVFVLRGPFENAVSARLLASHPSSAGIPRGPRLLRNVENVEAATAPITTLADLLAALPALLAGQQVTITVRVEAAR